MRKTGKKVMALAAAALMEGAPTLTVHVRKPRPAPL